MPFEKTGKSRADLLLLLDKLQNNDFAGAAECAGYYYQQKARAVKSPPELPKSAAYVAEASEQLTLETPSIGKNVPFWRVAKRKEKNRDDIQHEAPEWYKAAKKLDLGNVRAPQERAAPPHIPLIPWPTLWPFLRDTASEVREGRNIDTDRAVNLIATLKVAERLPMAVRRKWAPRCTIILDFGQNLVPLRRDVRDLLGGFASMRGEAGLHVFTVENGPSGGFNEVGVERPGYGDFKMPEPGTPVLIVSDLGFFDKSGTQRRSWLKFGLRLERAGFSPIVLTPAPRRLWDKEVCRIFKITCWDRGSRPGKFHACSSAGVSSGERSEGGDTTVGKLLTLLSSAVRVEPELLRAVRLLLPGEQADSSHEVEVWRHEDVWSSYTGICLNPELVELYREKLAKEPVELRERVFSLIHRHHEHLPLAVGHEEKLIESSFTGNDAGDSDSFFKSCACTLDTEIVSANKGFERWMVRVTERQHHRMWRNEALCVSWIKLHRENLERGIGEIPDGLDLDKFQWLYGGKGEGNGYTLVQKGGKFQFDETGKAGSATEEKGFQAGSPLSDIFTGNRMVRLSFPNETGLDGCSLNLNNGDQIEFPVPKCDEFVMDTDHDELIVKSLVKPDWADGIGRDEKGLFVIISEGGESRKVYWVNPGRHPVGSGGGITVDHGFFCWSGEEELFKDKEFKRTCWSEGVGKDEGGLFVVIFDGEEFRKAYWFNPGRYPVEGGGVFTEKNGFFWNVSEEELFKEGEFKRPEWADTIAVDEHGLYAEFRVGSNVQRMRWIVPGEFMMGSPEDEPERYDDEKRHKVILTAGFWLLDTAVTQGLWEALTGQNPSEFKGENNPVENVSWDDSIGFIKKLNETVPGLELRLPTEAEWEYACRAGTTGPFHFGDNITTDQVNYDGDHPYAGAEKQKSLEKTVPVKSFPCNAFGLYEMHGNVWEWCSDWFEAYEDGPVSDPVGPDKGEDRVLRGGGWFNNGGNVRSAFRHWYEPEGRLSHSGLRLARGQKGKSPCGAGQGKEQVPDELNVNLGDNETERADGFLSKISRVFKKK